MKKAIGVLLLICIVTLSLASCASFSEEDKTTAQHCANKATFDYYSENFEGKTISGVSYSSCSTSIKSSEFKGGKYIVTVSLSAKISSGGYSITSHLMDIKYSITVKNGTPTIVNKDYIN